ncbi:tetratricopeptide repeat protein [Roseateles violae]|uniref:Tetratricopeptide repeat protein n=1 Tax=Roseateles violae TaxID=3058042 RepID=A0ABT8DPG0_9BURK|nr:tetratricopeptide repeat protein [Pelomonas sp. PFR6]MDN3919863.1 tetratricopeptide repeat protein [Pelomonas sp. PFR6]
MAVHFFRGLLAGLCIAGTAAAAAASSTPAPAPTTARLTVLLEQQDYRAAEPLLRPLLARRTSSEAERAAIYVWLFARDDLAEVERRAALGEAAVDRQARGRLALERRDFEPARQQFEAALARATRPAERAAALKGLGQIAYQQRDFDASLARLQQGLAEQRTADGLVALADTLIRLGRTEEAIAAAEQALALNRFHEQAHYLLGNGYTRLSYTQLEQRDPVALKAATALVHQGAAAFVRGDFAAARDLGFGALRRCPGFGRAHALLAKALESQRFAIDVHRADYERRFAALPMPEVPAIERYVLNWAELSPRHQKRVALSVAPWKAFIPLLVEGGATHYIKPLDMKLSDTPGGRALKDQRIEYDSRLWDDVRGAGGYHTVTGIEDVERSIFERYNTVLHELTHQVHGVLTAEQSRAIQELYRQAKERDAKTRQAFLSRYAGGSVWEYFAEGANALESPRRDRFDHREIVRERLAELDPALLGLVQQMFALREVSASLPIAFVNAGYQRLEDGQLAPALDFFERARQVAASDERVLGANLYGRALQGDGSGVRALAAEALALHPRSGELRVSASDALWHSGRPLAELAAELAAAREGLAGEDRFRVELALADAWRKLGEGERALAAYEAALAYQADSPEALWGRAASLALLRRWDEAFALYERVTRLRTGLLALRTDQARDLLRAGRFEPAREQLQAARLLDAGDPNLLALEGAWSLLAAGDAAAALRQAEAALAKGPWCDLALIVQAAALRALGRADEARLALTPLRRRIEQGAAPGYVFRPEQSSWISVHELPAVERAWMEELLARR